MWKSAKHRVDLSMNHGDSEIHVSMIKFLVRIYMDLRHKDRLEASTKNGMGIFQQV